MRRNAMPTETRKAIMRNYEKAEQYKNRCGSYPQARFVVTYNKGSIIKVTK